MDDVETISGDDDEAIRELLLWRTITKVADDKLLLDNGTVLTIVPNDGCGGCPNGNYYLNELNGCPNAITAVEFEDEEDAGDEIMTVFVLAEDQQIKLLEVSGNEGNGYYGRGYRIKVTRGG